MCFAATTARAAAPQHGFSIAPNRGQVLCWDKTRGCLLHAEHSKAQRRTQHVRLSQGDTEVVPIQGVQHLLHLSQQVAASQVCCWCVLSHQGIQGSLVKCNLETTRLELHSTTKLCRLQAEKGCTENQTLLCDWMCLTSNSKRHMTACNGMMPEIQRFSRQRHQGRS